MRQGCLVMSTICLTLGIGITWAIFHASGSLFSAMLQFVIEETWYARISAYSFGSQLGISSGPAAFRGFNFSSADSDTISGVRSFSRGRNRFQSLKRPQRFNKRRIEHIAMACSERPTVLSIWYEWIIHQRQINMSHLILNNFSELFSKDFSWESYILILMIVFKSLAQVFLAMTVPLFH